ADIISCDSLATAEDAKRLVALRATKPQITIVDVGLNYSYQRVPDGVVDSRLKGISHLRPEGRFVVHVGSNLRRKNREGVLRIFAKCADSLDAQMVFVGERLSDSLHTQARDLQIEDRIIDLRTTPNELLEALYNRAHALLYPSRFEGFGWPIIEAQACGCPVVCSNSGPLPEAAGDAGLFHDVDDEPGFAADLLRLSDPAQRTIWGEKSLRNAERFSTSRMVSQYIDIYRSLGAQL